jgi:NADPH2:quinone reductase
MEKFKAFRVYNENGKIQGRVEPLDLESLSPGEVVIRSSYSSVNYKDALGATGAGKILRRFPMVAGVDVAGKVVTSSDARYKPGDAVLVTGCGFGEEHDGGYSEYARLPANWVVPLPKGLTLREAMSLGTAGFTAALCIQRLETNGLKPENGPVVVTGATGGVGSVAVDLLSKLGYRVTAVTGKQSEHDYLKQLGATEILDRKKIDYGSRPLEKAVWGGAIDNVGGDMLAWLTRTVQPWGSIAAVGLAGGFELHTTVMPFILRGVNLLGINSAGCPMPLRLKIWERLATDLHPRHIDKIVARTVSLDELPGVFDTLLKGGTRGRTLVKIHGD